MEMEMERKEFLGRFKRIVDDTWELFQKKNEQYGSSDPFANFRSGARLQYADEDVYSMYNTLLGYMNKHVAHVYNNSVEGQKVRESLGDIVVYSIIGMVMVDYYTEHLEKAKRDALHDIEKRTAEIEYDRKFNKALDGLCDAMKRFEEAIGKVEVEEDE